MNISNAKLTCPLKTGEKEIFNIAKLLAKYHRKYLRSNDYKRRGFVHLYNRYDLIAIIVVYFGAGKDLSAI